MSKGLHRRPFRFSRRPVCRLSTSLACRGAGPCWQIVEDPDTAFIGLRLRGRNKTRKRKGI